MRTDRTGVTGPEDDPAMALLPGVPVEILERYRRAAGDEIGTGKFTSPQSSAALAANTFGYFMKRCTDLPALPRWTESWSPRRVDPEDEVRFPWTGGHHPWLDAVVETGDFLIGVESKRYEPFDSHSRTETSAFSEAYWRDEWGNAMQPYQWLRDGLAHRPQLFRHLNAAQLVKHAFGLRTQARKRVLRPVLVYLHAQPTRWPGVDGKVIAAEAHAEHAEEVRCFARMVAGGEVPFLHFTYNELLRTFDTSLLQHVRDHAVRLRERFDIG
jgi:hypothetical protein